MLQDPLFAGRSLSLIDERLIGAEWALSIVCDELRRLFARASEVIAERSHDLDDVLDRVLTLLGGTKGDLVLPVNQSVTITGSRPCRILVGNNLVMGAGSSWNTVTSGAPTSTLLRNP